MTIDIPEDLYRKLGELARPFVDNKPADVIQRILAEWELLVKHDIEPITDKGTTTFEVGDLHCKGGVIPHGTKLRRRFYKGHSFEAEVRNGRIWFNGKSYTSPSRAAAAVAESVGVRYPRINGWLFWEHLDPSEGEWVFLNELRDPSWLKNS